MEQLQAQHVRLLSHVKTPFERSLMTQINWQSRLIAIRGARGVGKTTMLLQYIKKTYGSNPQKALYASMDHLYFSHHTLLELADRFINEEANVCVWTRYTNTKDGVVRLKISMTDSLN